MIGEINDSSAKVKSLEEAGLLKISF